MQSLAAVAAAVIQAAPATTPFGTTKYRFRCHRRSIISVTPEPVTLARQ